MMAMPQCLNLSSKMFSFGPKWEKKKKKRIENDRHFYVDIVFDLILISFTLKKKRFLYFPMLSQFLLWITKTLGSKLCYLSSSRSSAS